MLRAHSMHVHWITAVRVSRARAAKGIPQRLVKREYGGYKECQEWAWYIGDPGYHIDEPVALYLLYIYMDYGLPDIVPLYRVYTSVYYGIYIRWTVIIIV